VRRITMVLSCLIACGSSPPDDAVTDAPPGGGGDGPPPVDAPPSMATCEGKMAQPRDATWTIMHGGRMRTAKVHVPASYAPQTRTPVVLNIHGRTSNSSSQANLSHAVAKSDSAGFILVHPESATTPTAWNAGTCCDPATSSNLDDVGFIGALLDELEAKLCVDTDRVYSMGLSNGGYLSHKLACEMADRIAAIGPVAGLLLQNPCSPSRPVATMMVNGTSDNLSLYQFVGQAVTFWKGKNGCTTESTTYQNGDTTCVTQGGCQGGADVTLCTVNGGGHQWPGGEELPFLGHKSDDIIATDALWDFFVAHPRSPG
jgi:polyhydroxybutyrate depolymerase